MKIKFSRKKNVLKRAIPSYGNISFGFFSCLNANIKWTLFFFTRKKINERFFQFNSDAI